MTSSKLPILFCSAVALAALPPLAGCSVGVEDPTTSEAAPLSSKCEPSAPGAIAVPEGNRVAFFFDAVGVQIYACRQLPTGFAWAFQAPEANLLNRGGQLAGTHFVGPTWEANDGSRVVGARLAGATVDPTAIPLLLLKAVSNEGDGRMAKITFIQRLDTAGGLAPPAADCNAGTVNAIARVDYAATYFFYEAQNGNPHGPDCE
jgi:hypothetical protein